MLNVSSELKNCLHGSVGSMICTCTVQFLFMLWNWNRCQTEYWKGESGKSCEGERWDEIRAAKTRETEALHWMTEVLLKVVSHSLTSHDMQQQIWCSLFKRLWKPFLPLQLILVIKEFFHLNSWDSWYFLCVYSQVLRLERYNPHGHYKFHRTD